MSLSGVKTYANATTTNSEGYAFITLSAPNGTYTLAVNETNGANMASFGWYMFASPIGEPQFSIGSYFNGAGQGERVKEGRSDFLRSTIRCQTIRLQHPLQSGSNESTSALQGYHSLHQGPT